MDLASGTVRKQRRIGAWAAPTGAGPCFEIANSLDDALSAITDGCMLVVPREVSGVPMEATRALIRRGIKRLHLVALPTSSLQADLLIGAGCVETLETSAVSLGEYGPAPRFTAAILGGHDQDEGRDLPGAARGLAGDRERRAVHAAARADRLRRSEIPRRLEGDRQSVRRQRSDRAAAGDQAGRRAVSRADGRRLRQCLDRPPARTGHHGACGGEDHRDGRAAFTPAICWRRRCWPPAPCPASMSTASR